MASLLLCSILYRYPAYSGNDNSKKDAIADKAQQLIDKAEAILGKENSETDVIKSMIASAHMMVDPQSRYMTYGPPQQNLLKNQKHWILQIPARFYSKQKVNFILQKLWWW